MPLRPLNLSAGKRVAVAALLGLATAMILRTGARLTCPDSTCQRLPWDDAVLALMRSWQTPTLDVMFVALTWLGSLFVLLPLSLYLAWRRYPRCGPRTACFVPIALVGAALWAHASKLLINRPRPDPLAALIDMPADMSYPSAHTLQAGAFVLGPLITRCASCEPRSRG